MIDIMLIDHHPNPHIELYVPSRHAIFCIDQTKSIGPLPKALFKKE
jgi:hypothetical protein